MNTTAMKSLKPLKANDLQFIPQSKVLVFHIHHGHQMVKGQAINYSHYSELRQTSHLPSRKRKSLDINRACMLENSPINSTLLRWLLTLWSVCYTTGTHMPCRLEELLRPKGGTPYSAAVGQHQHHLWHLVNPLQPTEERQYSHHGKYSTWPNYQSQKPNLNRNYNTASKASS